MSSVTFVYHFVCKITFQYILLDLALISKPSEKLLICKSAVLNDLELFITHFFFLFYVDFNSHSHIVTGSLRVEKPVHTSWSRLSTLNCRAFASNCQYSNMKCNAEIQTCDLRF